MLPVANCTITDLVCCTSLFNIADHLCIEVNAAVSACIEGGPCAPITAYVTMGDGDDGVTDSLAVNFIEAAPIASRPGVMFPVVRARYNVRLRESGWPLAEIVGGGIIPPDPVAQMALARHAFAHGEVMYRKLVQLQQRRQLAPASVKGAISGSLSSMSALPPRGGTIGFVVTVTVDVPWDDR